MYQKLQCICESNAFLISILTNKYTIAVFYLFAFFVLIKIVNRILRKTIDRIKRHKNDAEFEKQANTLKFIVISAVDTVLGALMLFYILEKIGVDVRPILTAAGVLGVAVGFGAKRFVEDIITGLIIIIEGQIRVGDVVTIADKTGFVEKMDLKLVVLRDMAGNVHFIRNGMIDIVTNMTRDFSFYVLDVGISYEQNIDEVIKVLKEIDEDFQKNNPLAIYALGPLEILGVERFADSNVLIRSKIKTKPIHQWEVGRELNRLVKNRFDELGIDIPVPCRKLTIEKMEKSGFGEV